MIAHSIFFYFFSIIAIFSALMVITSRSTINSVFFFNFRFYLSLADLFIMVGAEFLGMQFNYIRGGSSCSFFICCNDVKCCTAKTIMVYCKKSTHIPSGIIVSVLIFLELLVVIGGWKYKDNIMSTSTLIIDEKITNTQQIGNVIYT